MMSPVRFFEATETTNYANYGYKIIRPQEAQCWSAEYHQRYKLFTDGGGDDSRVYKFGVARLTLGSCVCNWA